MDSAGIVALLIVILFFFKGPVNKTTSGQAAQPNFTASQPDKSVAGYQYVSDDRMDSVIKKYNQTLTPAEISRIKIATNIYSKEKDLDPRLLLAMMARESGFNPKATSPSGAKGIGQILPENYTSLGITDPYDIDQNIKGLAYYLRLKMEDWKAEPDQLSLALASYLNGTGAVQRDNKVLDSHTQTYVNDILKIRSSI